MAQHANTIPPELQEIHEGMEFLKQIEQFKDVNNDTFMMSLYKKVNKRVYKLGEIIQEEEKVPPCIFMIKRGCCQTMLRGKGERRYFRGSEKTLKCTRNNKKLTKEEEVKVPYRLAKKDPLLQDFIPENSLLNQINFNDKSFQNQRILIDENGQENKYKIKFENQMHFRKINQGGTFGGRCLLSYQIHQIGRALAADGDYFDKISEQLVAKSTQEEIHEAMKSFLTVVADSARVEIWTLDRAALQHAILENAHSMGEAEIHGLYRRIMTCRDCDRGPYTDSDVHYIREQFLNWDRFKQECVEQLRMERLQKEMVHKYK